MKTGEKKFWSLLHIPCLSNGDGEFHPISGDTIVSELNVTNHIIANTTPTHLGFFNLSSFKSFIQLKENTSFSTTNHHQPSFYYISLNHQPSPTITDQGTRWNRCFSMPTPLPRESTDAPSLCEWAVRPRSVRCPGDSQIGVGMSIDYAESIPCLQNQPILIVIYLQFYIYMLYSWKATCI